MFQNQCKINFEHHQQSSWMDYVKKHMMNEFPVSPAMKAYSMKNEEKMIYNASIYCLQVLPKTKNPMNIKPCRNRTWRTIVPSI